MTDKYDGIFVVRQICDENGRVDGIEVVQADDHTRITPEVLGLSNELVRTEIKGADVTYRIVGWDPDTRTFLADRVG